MVPNKFNIVDFGGFDLAEQYGGTIPGIYDKIVNAHWNCVYIMCFGLKFGGFNIAPQYMTPEMFSDHIMLNGIISIDENDVITIPSIEPPAPPPVPPVIQPLNVSENGIYIPPSGVDGYAPVTVDVSGAGPDRFISTTVGDYVTGWYDERKVTRVLATGAKLIHGLYRPGYNSGGFYTLVDYGVVGNVVSGSYISKTTITGIEFPDGAVHTIYGYGGFGGGGLNGASYMVKQDSDTNIASIITPILKPSGYFMPTTAANYGPGWAQMTSEAKEYVLNLLMQTIE